MTHEILLIDDDADDREMFCEAVAEIGAEIICNSVADGRVAFSSLNNLKIELPDIIFLDINMPLISGWECLTKLKEHEVYKNIPVIMYSTSSNEADAARAKSLGALCFFTKPPNFRELKKGLEIIIQRLKSNTLSSTMLTSDVCDLS